MHGISAQKIIDWLKELEKIQTGRLTCPNFLKPFHLITLGLSIQKARLENFRLPKKLEGYAIRMGLWDALNISPPYNVPRRPEEGRFIPIHGFCGRKDGKDENDISCRLSNLTKKHFSANPANETALNNCLSEIINNFFDHANVDTQPCLLAAQSWPRSNRVQIAITDVGIGIRESLSTNPDLSDKLHESNACKIASEYGVTSKPTEGHSGYGLTLAKDLMNGCNGTYLLLSNNEYFSPNMPESASTMNFFWQGTLLILEWNTTKQLDIGSVYEKWPTSEGFDEDDFF